jgi:hypothetical protein
MFFTLNCYANTELTKEQSSAKNTVILYNQYKATSAIPFLTTAAEAGDSKHNII